MGFRGWRKDSLQCNAASALERNRFASITKSTNTAAYSTYGSEVDGVTEARAAVSAVATGGYKVSIYPTNSMSATFLLRLAGTVSKGSALFPVANGCAVTSTVTAATRGQVTAPSTAVLGDTYIVPSAGWSAAHGNAIAVCTNATGPVFTYTDVDATTGLGTTVYITDEGRYYTWNGSSWVLAKIACYANEAGVSGDEIEAYTTSGTTRATRDRLPQHMNFTCIKAGTAVVTNTNTSVAVSDDRILATDIVVASVAVAGTNAVTVLSAVCTSKTMTITTANPGTAGVTFNYAIFRQIA